jgi:hypothetical protein
MLSVFGDESADETQKRVFAVAGLIGTDEMWEQLAPKWVVRNGEIPFHAKDCDSDRGDYKTIPHAENKALYRDLAIMLAESELAGYGIAIDLLAARRWFPDSPEISYYKGFIEVVQAMKNVAINTGETVKFTFDMRPEGDHNTGLLYGTCRLDIEWAQYTFSEISFACAKDHPRLQMADLFAREAMKVWDNKIGPKKRGPRKSWLALYNSGRFVVEVFGDEWFNDLKRQMPKLEEATGMSGRECRQWLEERKLQCNTTNLFRYMQWVSSRDKEISN